MANLALAFDILAKDKNASKTFDKVGDAAERAGKKSSMFGGMLKSAVGIAAGAIAAAGIGSFFKDSITEARESQKVGAITAQVIKSTGKAAKVTADQVGDLATAISNTSGIDDEAIQSGANLLLTFKNVRNEAGKGNDIFSQTTQIMTDMATAMGQEPKAAAIQLGKALNDPIRGITTLTRVGVTFTDAQKKQIKALVESGDVMGAQKIILAELNSEFGGTAAAASTAGEKFKTAFKNLEEQIGTALLPVIDKVATFMTTKVIPAVSTFIKQLETGEGVGGRVRGVFDDITGAVKTVVTWGKKDLFPTLRTAYETVLPGVQTALDAIWPKVQSIANVTWGKLQSGIDALKSLTTLDFSKIDGRKLAQQLGVVIADGLNGLVKIAGKLTDSLGKLFGKVDWVGIGILIGKQVPALLLGLAAGILNFDFGSLLVGIKDHWFDVLMGVLAIAFAPSKVAGGLVRILAKIPFVGRFLGIAVTWLNELGGKLTSFGGDLLKTFWRGFTNTPIPGVGFVTRFVKAIGSLPGRLRGFLVSIQTRIGVWALDAFEAMGRGARKAIGALVSFVGRLPGRILRAVGSLAHLLFPRGSEAIAGMARGIAGRIGGVLSTVRGLPGRILSALGNLGSLLLNAGKEIIGGLLRGITEKFEDVKHFVGGIGSWIGDHKGPLSYDRRLLVPAGKAIIGGLDEGLQSEMGGLERTLDRITNRIAGAPLAATAQPSPTGSGIDYERFAQAVADAVSRLHMSVPVSSVDRAVVGRIA